MELAELVAGRLGLRTEYAWFLSHYGRRAIRNTLLADRCDAYFGLPDDADFNKVNAEFKNGVLTVHVPKSEQAKPKQIDVKVA